MSIVNIHEAKTHFSQLINQVLQGKEIVIARGGKPLVKLIPYSEKIEPRLGGQFKGLMTINEDFDDPLPNEFVETFYNKE